MTIAQAQRYFSEEEWFWFTKNVIEVGVDLESHLSYFDDFCWGLVSAFTWHNAECPAHEVPSEYWSTIANSSRTINYVGVVLENALKL